MFSRLTIRLFIVTPDMIIADIFCKENSKKYSWYFGNVFAIKLSCCCLAKIVSQNCLRKFGVWIICFRYPLTLLPTAYSIPLFHPPTGKHTRRGLRPIIFLKGHKSYKTRQNPKAQTPSFENGALKSKFLRDL